MDLTSIDVGFWSVVPPLIAIVLALLTKEVISSLIIGILSGACIYTIASGLGFVGIFQVTMSLMADKLGSNGSMILFLALLGALVAVITMAGGSRAYGEWASQKLKGRRSALLATSALGALIFVDDYFNCLTIGTVMRPVTDKFKISRAKLAYLIDATAAPICIIAPISSWAASVISQLTDAGVNGMETFVQTIPYNLYALLTIAMVVAVSVMKKADFGPMARFERNAVEKGDLHSRENPDTADDELQKVKISDKGKVWDLVVPIAVLIVLCILSMLYVGGYFAPGAGMTLADGFGNTDAGPALALGAFGALIFTFLYYRIRRVLSFKDFMGGITMGVKSMVPAFIILTLAWTISGVCRDLLNTGGYVGSLVKASQMPVALIPAIIFAIASVLSFSTGTSWGTFGILIPIVATVCQSTAPELMVVSLAATLAGSVLGDHCSPISDTTILSSTGAGCNHLDHVSTQLPYVLTVGVCCLVGYLVAGFTNNLVLTLVVSFGMLGGALVLLSALTQKRLAKGKA
ncbi:MAG: Na+/H+ antiporter NhaC family protein, partial [Eubacteriales bacterium]|nr:Na+/H+ antiporter NhaC family protein [Eubacteriales bacterium]